MSLLNRVGLTSASTLRSSAAAAAMMLALVSMLAAQPYTDHGNEHRRASSLTETVRDATRPFLDITVASNEGYAPFLGCVSGPEEGAMGVHYVNGGLVADGELDATRPEALLYHIVDGRARLLGVEFIVDAATWLSQHQSPPVLDGQSFQFVGSPNRFGLDPFFELHVWAWKENPNGTFSDWNTHVSCDVP